MLAAQGGQMAIPEHYRQLRWNQAKHQGHRRDDGNRQHRADYEECWWQKPTKMGLEDWLADPGRCCHRAIGPDCSDQR